MFAKLIKVTGLITTSVLFRIVAGTTLVAACLSSGPVSSVASLIPGDGSNTKAVDAESRVGPRTITNLRLNSPDTFTETAKLMAADAAAFDQFGSSVAISGDYAIVGASRDDDSRGAAYIYFRSGNAWTQQQKLIATDGAVDDNFGWSVSVNGDTAVVGAYGDDNSGFDQGSAYVFVRSGAIWSQQQKLVATDGSPNDQFGSAVAINGDTIIVGAFGDDGFRGSAYSFARNQLGWFQQQKLTAPDGSADDDFGWTVALNGDSAVIGSPRDDGSRGSAFVFVRTVPSPVWTQQQKLTAADGASLDQFGYSVAISGDHIVAGAVNDAPAGSAYVFFRTGSTWGQQQKLNASGAAANDNFGTSVAIDGLSLIVGANGADNGTSPDRGRASVWVRTSQVQTAWTESQQIVASDGATGDNFGVSVALSGDNAIVGSYLDDSAASDTGSAYVFNHSGVNPTPTPTPVPVTISGRVLRPSGQVLANTRVFLTGPDGLRQIATTGSFGIYNFSNVVSGRTYTLTALSKRYRFAVLSVTPSGDMSGLDLAGLE